MNSVAEAFIPIIAIIFTFGIPGALIFWYLYIKDKERTKLMDMGLTPQELDITSAKKERRPKNPLSSLKWGILLSMIGIGLFFGILLDEAGFKDSLSGVMVLLFGGLGFIIYYFIANSKLKKDAQIQQSSNQNS